MLDWIERHLGLAVVLGVVIAIATNVVMAVILDALGVPWVFTPSHGVQMVIAGHPW